MAAAALLAAATLAGGTANPAWGQQRPRDAQGSQVTLAKRLPGISEVRFFTINEVLRKRDASGSDAGVPAPIRIASIDMAKLRGTLTDVTAVAYPVMPKAGPFGMSSFRAPEGLLWVKWRKVEAEMREDASIVAQCRGEPDRCPAPEARRVSAIIEAVEARSGRARLEEVNRAVNGAIRYTSDLAQHGVPDLWSATLATFSNGRGDCEDYAIAKYVILRAAGVPTDDLKIMLVRDLTAREAHAVLAAQVNSKWFILDNRRSEISEDREISHFVPLFSLDHKGVSLLAQSYAAASSGEELESVGTAGASQMDLPAPSPASGASLEF